MKKISLIIHLFLFSISAGLGAQPGGKPEIRLYQKKITVNGTDIVFPAPLSDLKKALGVKFRKTEKSNVILTWDSAGIIAYQSKDDPEKISAIDLFIKKFPYEHCPKSVFSGSLYIDSYQFSDYSKGDEFVKQGFSHDAKSNKMYMIGEGYSIAVIQLATDVQIIDIGEIIKKK